MIDLTDNQLIILLTAVLVIFAFISIFQGIYYHKKKKLLFLVGPSFSLVNIKESFKEKIKVLYNDYPVDNISSIQVIIQNSGNLPIMKKDIIVPIMFNFDEQIKIIDWKKISTKPEGLAVNINMQSDTKVYCDFELLNPKYEIKLQFVCIGEEIKPPKIDATMIAGTKYNVIPYEQYLEEKNVYKNMKYFIFTFFLGLGLLWLTSLTKNPFIIVSLFIIGFIVVIFSVVFLVYFTWGGIIKDIYSYLKRKSSKSVSKVVQK